MGQRGPAPKPTALRLIDGDREDRINRHEPVPRSGAMVCPDEVSPAVREVWDYTVAELEHMGIDAPADRDSLVCYCEAVVAHRQASRVLAGSSVLVKGLHGTWVRNPALQIQRDAAQTIRGFAQEFGLTPSARSRIENRGEDADNDNPFAAAT